MRPPVKPAEQLVDITYRRQSQNTCTTPEEENTDDILERSEPVERQHHRTSHQEHAGCTKKQNVLIDPPHYVDSAGYGVGEMHGAFEEFSQKKSKRHSATRELCRTLQDHNVRGVGDVSN